MNYHTIINQLVQMVRVRDRALLERARKHIPQTDIPDVGLVIEGHAVCSRTSLIKEWIRDSERMLLEEEKVTNGTLLHDAGRA